MMNSIKGQEPANGPEREDKGRELDALELQAHAWVRHFASGAGTKEDARALRAWCSTSEAHARALQAARHMWHKIGPAAELAAFNDMELAALRLPRKKSALASPSRRAFIGAAVAATATVTAVVVYPPFDLWPAATHWQADYRTGPGEQRRFSISPHVSIELNTRSSVALRNNSTANSTAAMRMELLAGELAVEALDSLQRVEVASSDVQVSGRDVHFTVRRMEDDICVTCLAGTLDVIAGERSVTLEPQRQLNYNRRSVSVQEIDPIEATAWREGFLNFRNTALSQVVQEINRYRQGRVLLLNKNLADQPVSGRFHIHDLEKAISQIQRLFRLDVAKLPGGVVILS